jgi:hypothetical protein
LTAEAASRAMAILNRDRVSVSSLHLHVRGELGTVAGALGLRDGAGNMMPPDSHAAIGASVCGDAGPDERLQLSGRLTIASCSSILSSVVSVSDSIRELASQCGRREPHISSMLVCAASGKAIRAATTRGTAQASPRACIV